MGRSDSDLGSRFRVDGKLAPAVRYRWLPLTYQGLFGIANLVQANRHYENVRDALRMLRFVTKVHARKARPMYREAGIAREMPMSYFRGQSRVQYQLIPSLYRGAPFDDPQDDIWFSDLIALSAAFIQQADTEPAFKSLTLEQKRATARHYGIPNDYLDLTRDPHVAAFFATRDLGEHGETYPGADVDGVIYMISLFSLAEVFRLSWQNTEDGVALSFHVPRESFKIPYLTINERNAVQVAEIPMRGDPNGPAIFTFRWTKPRGIRRVEAQDALFLRSGPPTMKLFDEATLNWTAAVQAWQILDFMAIKFIFAQTSPYADFGRGIRRRKLIPPGDRLQAMADNLLVDPRFQRPEPLRPSPWHGDQ